MLLFHVNALFHYVGLRRHAGNTLLVNSCHHKYTSSRLEISHKTNLHVTAFTIMSKPKEALVNQTKQTNPENTCSMR